MEARFGGDINGYGPMVTDMKNTVGKRALDWDLNKWKWDGDCFLATPMNPAPPDCTSRLEIEANINVSNSLSSCSKETNPTTKRSRVEVFPELELNDEVEPLSLKLGNQIYPIDEDGVDKLERKSGKKSILGGNITNQPVCQVEDCIADLSDFKQYHRKHKVCKMHSKASKALVRNVMQRFCQQCSRFHVLEAFDEEKRSCRSRLDGHNKRRRKTHPETSVNVGSLVDERSYTYKLISLLRILSNLHTNGSDQLKDQDLLSYLSRNLAGPINASTISELLKGSQHLINVGVSSGIPEKSCTDRIVFKLFGKDPIDLPHDLRPQVLDWLSHRPTDMEGYIRPGCIVLTIYLRLNKSSWEEFCYDMTSILSRLLNMPSDPFWKTGWIYTRVQQRAAFICDGRVVLDTPLPFKNRTSRILSISPLAVPAAETVQWVVRGSNLAQPTSRLHCAIEGRYLVQESCYGLMEGADTTTEQDVVQSLSFRCSIPDVNGRGFIEVEDYGLTGCFFPFIVAEPEICSEICMLEKVIEVVYTGNGRNDGQCGIMEARNQALEFIHEMGWLLHRNGLRFKTGKTNSPLDLFPFGRLKWLVEFSMDHDWCCVLRKLLDLVCSGIVDAGECASIELALSEMGLLHNAVRKNSRRMVLVLLTYVPRKVHSTCEVYGWPLNSLFRPDVAGTGGLTPLHVAASTGGSENVLDALLEDSGLVGIEAWKNAHDSTGLTPNDYANLRGHYSYIHLVHQKINKRSSGTCTVVVDISSPSHTKPNPNRNKTDELIKSLHTEKFQLGQSCKLCVLKLNYGYTRAAFACRPAVFSLVAIAAVCVCAALFFKSLPRVGHVFEPFRWESLNYGAM